VSIKKRENGTMTEKTGKAVPEELEGQPLDAVVRGLFSLSWGKSRAFIATGKVQLDGATVTVATRRVRKGSEIELRMNAPRKREAELADDRVIYVDTHVVVIDKPAGVSTIPFDESESGTLDERVRSYLARKAPDRSGRPALGVVHRLDKETSGLIVFTRTWLAKKSLTQQFREHSVVRRYLALAHGDVRPQTIRTHLVSDRGDGLRGSVTRPGQRTSKKKSATKDNAPQLAITHVEVVERLPGATLVACRLETGRTHQIRIHLSEAGHPILGERVYIRRFGGDLHPAPRLMLHAAELGFVHPATERQMQWEQPLPEDMESMLTLLRAKK
jgi:23S rRNA pseudouridine1911/1915/1917 synthase